MQKHGHASDPTHRESDWPFRNEKEEFSGAWVAYSFDPEPCRIRSENGKRRKKGWELHGYLVYCDSEHRLWIVQEGYLWDGPSYPSAESSFMGKALKWLVGNRKKRGLLAASAIHDIMVSPTQVIPIDEDELNEWKNIANLEQLNQKIETKSFTIINIGIVEAARIYYRMLKQWPNDTQTIASFQQVKQLIGLILFQPLYRLFITGPTKTIWKKIL